MAPGHPITTNERNQVLEDSIRQQRPLVLTHNGPEGWRTFRSEFVSGSAASHLIKVSQPVFEETAGFWLVGPGETLGVTFRTGHKKCVFGTVVEPHDDHATESVVTLRWPDHLQQIQRRLFERAQPPQGAVIPVRLWQECSSAAPGQDVRTIRHGQLEDLSAGGMRVKVHDAGEFHAGRTYRCVFTPRAGGPSIVVDALPRHRQAADQGRASIGLQFVGLEATPEGRRVLARIARTVSQFQRARSRGRKCPNG